MKPEALAWTLLFVIAFALVYRFFAWVGRRFRARPADPIVPAKVTAVPETAAALSTPAKETPTGTAPPAPSTINGTVADPPSPAAEPVPTPAAAREYGTAPAQAPTAIAGAAADAALAAPISPQRVVPATPVPATPVPGPSSAVMSARIAGEAVRAALAPSVAATMTPPSPPKPSITATLPPALAVALPEPQSVAAVLLPATAVAVSAALAHAMALRPADTPELPVADEPLEAKTIRLRARRIGAEPVKLDIRLRDSRERRVLRTPKIARKNVDAVPIKALRVLGPKTPLERSPSRRIGAKDGRPTVLLSIRKGATKVVGASRSPSRILPATAA